MDRATLLQQLVDAGCPQAFVDAIDMAVVDDAALSTLVNAYLAAKAGAIPPEEATVAQEGMTRDDMIAKIVELDPARDVASLEPMTDDELKALLIELGGEDAFREKKFRATVKPSASVALTPPANASPALVQMFAEARRALAEMSRKSKAFDVKVAAREAAERQARQAAEYAESVSHAERLVQEGRLPPAVNDGHLLARVRSRLSATKVARTYSEKGKSVTVSEREEFDQLVGVVAQSAGRGRSGCAERIVAKSGESAQKAFFDGIVAETKARYERANAAAEIPLRQRLGMVAPRHQR